jgi:phosphate butyryltransferase
MFKDFAEIREAARATGPKRVAVAGGADTELLRSLAEALRLGLARPTLVGDNERIGAAARTAGVDLAGFVVVGANDEAAVAPLAAGLVRAGQSDVLMKGTVDTAAFMKAVLDKDAGLRGGGLMSHIFVAASRRLGRIFLVTDGGINIAPTLEEKAGIVRNALPLARALGAAEPRVAVLCAIEKPNPKMPETLDAVELVKMNRAGVLSGCVVGGPLALDNCVSAEAAAKKGIADPVAGQAEVILVPSLVVGNSTCKAILYFAGDECGGYVAGAAAPVVFLSRADDARDRLNSIALGVLMGGAGGRTADASSTSEK